VTRSAGARIGVRGFFGGGSLSTNGRTNQNSSGETWNDNAPAALAQTVDQNTARSELGVARLKVAKPIGGAV
jgi:hypothetical protein